MTPADRFIPSVFRRRPGTIVILLALAASAASTSQIEAQAALSSTTSHNASALISVSAPSGSDSAAVIGVVERFHQALAAGDSATALSLLAPNAVILESGGLETLAEYRKHHLPADITFARAVPSTRELVRAVVQSDAAWVTSTSTTRGTYRDRAVDSAGAELMVLSLEPDGWRISAVHWSSQARRPAR